MSTQLDGFTPEEKQELLKDLVEAKFSGASRIKFRERDVTFRSQVELQKAIDELTRDLSGRRPRPAIFATFGRGT